MHIMVSNPFDGRGPKSSSWTPVRSTGGRPSRASPDVFDRELLALRALCDSSATRSRLCIETNAHVGRFHERLWPRFVPDDGIEPTQVGELLHDLGGCHQFEGAGPRAMLDDEEARWSAPRRWPPLLIRPS